MKTWVKTKTRAGDTVSTLTARYGVSKAALLRANGVVPAEDHTKGYLGARSKELALPSALPTAAASRVVEEDDICLWVTSADGQAVELQPGSQQDITRFANAPPGKYAVFAADSVVYLPEWTSKGATLPLDNIKPVSPALAPAPKAAVGGLGPMTSIARNIFTQLPRGQRLVGNYVLGAVPAGAKTYSAANSADVMEVQEILNDVWGASPKLDVDGVLGTKTSAALAAFQKANGLPSTGSLDRNTSLKLQDDDAVEIGTQAATTPSGGGAPKGSSNAGMFGLLGLLGLAGGVAAIVVHSRKGKHNPRRRRRAHTSRRRRARRLLTA